MDLLPSEFYTKYVSDRKQYEDRALLFSEMTLPYLIETEGRTASTQTAHKRVQGFCAKQVNSLKSKIGMALLPPSSSSFRFAPDPKMLEKVGIEGQNREKLYAELSMAQDKINKAIESQQVRGSVFDMIAHQLVIGSVLVEKLPDEGILLHPLKSFTVKLDRKGKPLAFCFIEIVNELPEDITTKDEKDEYELYTMVHYDKEAKVWVERQELDGELVGKEWTYKNYLDVPYRYLGWTWGVGDKYHRPYVEDLYPDMEQLNYHADLLTRGSLAAAKVVFMVNEQQGLTDKRDLESAMTGDWIHGRESDVSTVQAGKNYDFQVPMEREQNLKSEIAEAFLSNKSATRQAERVTAYEVQLMAQELEASTLGGIYSSMALDFSRWLVHQVMKEIGIKFQYKELRDVKILTGLDAIGRSQEAQKLDAYLQRMFTMNMGHMLNQSEIARRYAEYDSISTEGLLKTDEEIAKEQQQAQQQMAQQQAQESIAGETGGIVRDAAKQPAQPQQGGM
jgi:hypothetical protein